MRGAAVRPGVRPRFAGYGPGGHGHGVLWRSWCLTSTGMPVHRPRGDGHRGGRPVTGHAGTPTAAKADAGNGAPSYV